MTIANQRRAPRQETLGEFIELVPEIIRDAVRADVLGGSTAKPRIYTQTTFLERSAEREDQS